MSDLLTIRDIIRSAVTRFTEADLSFGHGQTTAFDEAVFIVLESLRLPPERLDIWLDARLTEPERQKLEQLIAARIETRKPAAYLLNRAYLQGVPFYVDERVIVPRSYIAEFMAGENGWGIPCDPSDISSVLDLCTGSGCLAILAAHILPEASIDAVDLSEDALAVASRNVEEHGLEDRVMLHRGNLFAPLKGRTYDLIITNPPYVDAEGMDSLPPEFRHEPRMALESGADGMDIVRCILKDAADYLEPRGAMICEVGRARETLERDYPHLPFLWLDAENGQGEVFFLTREQLLTKG